MLEHLCDILAHKADMTRSTHCAIIRRQEGYRRRRLSDINYHFWDMEDRIDHAWRDVQARRRAIDQPMADDANA